MAVPGFAYTRATTAKGIEKQRRIITLLKQRLEVDIS